MTTKPQTVSDALVILGRAARPVPLSRVDREAFADAPADATIAFVDDVAIIYAVGSVSLIGETDDGDPWQVDLSFVDVL